MERPVDIYLEKCCKTVTEEPSSKILFFGAPKESENIDNAIREDEGENSSTKSESYYHLYSEEEF